jgi:DNA-binding GntR family transcriptional regulator
MVDALREAILTGRYAPGTRLVEENLAAAFGMSRIPLREALRRLEAEGLVVISPNRGAVVRPLAPKDVVDLYEVRLALESLALRRAAERFADLRESTAARHAQARAAIATRNLSALFRLDRDFHADMAAASDNPHLVAALGAQWSQIMRVMHAYFEAGDYPADTWDDHAAIADAVAHGETDRAVEKLREHLIGSRDRILASLRAKARP